MHRVQLHVKRVECLAAGDTENRGRRDEPTMRPSRRVEVGELRALVDHVVDGTYVHLGTLLKCVHIWANGAGALVRAGCPGANEKTFHRTRA